MNLRRSKYLIVFSTLLLASLVLSSTQHGLSAAARMKALDVAAPLSTAFARARIALAQLTPFPRQDDDADALRSLRVRNAELQDAVAQLTTRLEDLQKTIESIPPDFRVASAPILTFVQEKAEVLSFDPSIIRSAAVILGGRKTGLRPGLGVVWRDQVAGKLVRVGERTSLVRFVHDPEFKMIARIARTGEFGLVVGTGTGCELRFVSADADIRLGDAIVSTGDEEIFPAGKYIGKVEALPLKTTLLQIPVQIDLPMSRVRSVYVLRKQSASSEFPQAPGGPTP